MAEKQSKIDVPSWETHFMSFFRDLNSVDLEFGFQIGIALKRNWEGCTLYSESCPQQ